MTNSIKFSVLSFGLLSYNLLFAQTTLWTDGGLDASWSNVANWSNGVPTSSSSLVISTQPSAGLIGIDTGVNTNTIGSLAFNAGLSNFTFLSAGIETLIVNGSITNNTSNNTSFTFGLSLTAGSSATWSGPLSYASSVGIGLNSITLQGVHSFSGGAVNFDITNVTTFGRFLGAGTTLFSGSTINIGGAYLGNLGDTFDFTTTSFAGATLGALRPLTLGLDWDRSNFISTGVLTVVAAPIPEPATYSAMAGAAVLGFAAMCRRRSRAG
jgi:hypothetical protein